MKIQNLRTLVAISENRTFVEAGEAIGLSHSAVSLHIKALEEELNVMLFDRSFRPPMLTDKGAELVLKARKLFGVLDEITSLSSQDALVGSLRVGVVQSALINLLPPALASLRANHPQLQIALTTGYSKDLATRVRRHELDVAVVAEPDDPIEDIDTYPVCVEPLYLLTPMNVTITDMKTLFSTFPYIWYDRSTWTGGQIERFLRVQKMRVQEGIEVDSFEAIEQLVRHGLGVSIAPKTTCGDDDFCDEVRVLPLPEPRMARNIVMLERVKNPRKHLADALLAELRKPKKDTPAAPVQPISGARVAAAR